MSNIGNRQIMSRNIRMHIQMKGKTRREVANETGIKYSTLCDWINCNKYPRIDNIEKLARYFGIEKSALIESEPVITVDGGLDGQLVKLLTDLSPDEVEKVGAFVQGLIAARPADVFPRSSDRQ